MHVWTAAVFGALNGMPKDLHGTDVMRVREWYLAGRGADYRQNILLSSFLSPELHALFSNFCHSHAGKAKLQMTQEVQHACQPTLSDLQHDKQFLSVSSGRIDLARSFCFDCVHT